MDFKSIGDSNLYIEGIHLTSSPACRIRPLDPSYRPLLTYMLGIIRACPFQTFYTSQGSFIALYHGLCQKLCSYLPS